MRDSSGDEREGASDGTAQEVFRAVLSCTRQNLHSFGFRRQGTHFVTVSDNGWFGSISFRRLRASNKRRLFFWIELEVISEHDGYVVWSRLLKEFLPKERLPSPGYEVTVASSASDICRVVAADLIPYGLSAIDAVLQSHDPNVRFPMPRH